MNLSEILSVPDFDAEALHSLLDEYYDSSSLKDLLPEYAQNEIDEKYTAALRDYIQEHPAELEMIVYFLVGIYNFKAAEHPDAASMNSDEELNKLGFIIGALLAAANALYLNLSAGETVDTTEGQSWVRIIEAANKAVQDFAALNESR